MTVCSGFPPKLYLIGAQKCATTYFADIIALHPDIVLARTKEVDFFSEHLSRGDEWFQSFFPNSDGKILFDASTSYSAEPFDRSERQSHKARSGVAARIHARAPDARIIYLVRDPVARTYSSYWHHVRLGEEKRPFHEAIKYNSWYLDLSRYHFQIMQYLALFPKDQIMVLDAGPATRAPLQEAQKVWDFIGLPAYQPEAISTDKRNASYRYNGIGKLLGSTKSGRSVLRSATKVARSLLPARTVENLRRAFTKDIPPMSDKDRALVTALLADDMEAFTKCTGLAFNR